MLSLVQLMTRVEKPPPPPPLPSPSSPARSTPPHATSISPSLFGEPSSPNALSHKSPHPIAHPMVAPTAKLPPRAPPRAPQPCLRHLLVGVGEAERAVVAHPGHAGAAGREADAVHPPAAAARLEHQLPKGHLGAPRRRARPLLHLLDVGGEDPGEGKKSREVPPASVPCCVGMGPPRAPSLGSPLAVPLPLTGT